MLRVSSLGHTSTTVVFQICRRLYSQRKYQQTATSVNSNVPTTPNVTANPIRGRQHGQNGRKEDLPPPSVLNTPDLALNSAAQGSPTSPSKWASEEDNISIGAVGLTTFPSTREAANEFMRPFMLQQDIDALLAEDILSPEQHVPPTITDPPPFAAGRPWSKKIVKPICFSSLRSYLRNIADDIEEEHRKHIDLVNAGNVVSEEVDLPSRFLPVIIKEHLVTLANTQDVEDAWHSYITLIDFITRIPCVRKRLSRVPFPHLHRLTRLIASNRPKTHRQYLRLLAVLTYLKHCGGAIMQYQYNALLDHSGKGWRKTREEEVQHVKRVARELQIGHLPGLAEEAYDLENEDYPGLNPDIYTYTTLLATAARASSTKELLNIASLMQKAGLPPNRITHLSLLRYFTQKRSLSGVRSTLQKMRYQNLELGLDGLNACMWAYGRNGRVEVAWRIYRLLRHNVVQGNAEDAKEMYSLLGEEYIFIEPNIRPNEVTFTMLIQMMAYLGHFQGVLDVFHDMLTFLNMEQGAPLVVGVTGEFNPGPYQPRVAVYRNIFLGFAKHGIPKNHARKPDESWTLENLMSLFDCFLQLRYDSIVTYANVDLIMKAFSVTSESDLPLMRSVWLSIEEKFGPIVLKPTSTNRLMRTKMQLFPEQFSGNSTPS